ncbi:hypothetical protein BXY85_0585 [Roseivirga pacifica]|uniref:Uncharacterized protein n=1 Tax=Roseivirga pacifica TaxID=1267423 RepID=A0A1I0RGT7_9BACT|nr:hypothetical protein BXY85_0585 [Roseivirga pacifica]SEW40042.1 hypothetical protein SAMN05216290_3531 [Roseivirga pacifica]
MKYAYVKSGGPSDSISLKNKSENVGTSSDSRM